MNLTVPPRRHAIPALLIALVLGFLVWDQSARVTQLQTLSKIGATDAEGKPVQPAGHTHSLVFPLVAMDTNWWVLRAEQMMARGERVRHTDQDNAPDGRDVHWSSPLLWVLAALAWLFRTIGAVPATDAVPLAAVWAGPLLFGVFLTALFAGVARRFDSATAACLVVALATAGPLVDNFSAGAADHHGMAAVLSLLAVWGICTGGAGRVSVDNSNARATSALAAPSLTVARRSFALAGIAGAAALWISAATAIPVLLAVALSSVLAARSTRHGRDALSRTAPELWSTWGKSGAIAALVFYAVEYLPSHPSWRLEVNHPLHALAWWAGAEWLTRAVRRIHGGRWFAGRNDRIAGALQSLAVLAPILLAGVGGVGFFSLGDPFLRSLHNDYIEEFRSLPSVLADAGWYLAPVSWVALFPITWLAWRCRTKRPDATAALLPAITASAVAVLLACAQVRWSGLAAAIMGGLVTLAFIVFRRGDWAAKETRVIRWTGALVVLGFLQQPILTLANQRSAAPSLPDTSERTSLVVRDVAWALRGAYPDRELTVLSGPTSSTQLAYFGGFRVLGTLYWENLEGLRAAAAIFSEKDPEAALSLCQKRGVTHIVIFSWDDFSRAYARLHLQDIKASGAPPSGKSLPENSMIPRWLRPVAYTVPAQLHLADETVTLFEVIPEQTQAEAHFYLGEHLRETGNIAAARSEILRAKSLLVAESTPGRFRSLGMSLAQSLITFGEDVEAASLYRAMLAQDPESRETSRLLAQLLATSQNPNVRDTREARRLAAKPVTSGYVLTLAEVETLAVSLAADGDITKAVNVARQGLAAAIRDKDDLMSARFTEFLEKSLVPASPCLDP